MALGTAIRQAVVRSRRASWQALPREGRLFWWRLVILLQHYLLRCQAYSCVGVAVGIGLLAVTYAHRRLLSIGS